MYHDNEKESVFIKSNKKIYQVIFNKDGGRNRVIESVINNDEVIYGR